MVPGYFDIYFPDQHGDSGVQSFFLILFNPLEPRLNIFQQNYTDQIDYSKRSKQKSKKYIKIQKHNKNNKNIAQKSGGAEDA